MINDEISKKLEDLSQEEKAILAKITSQDLYTRALKLSHHIKLCLEKNKIAKEINGVNIVRPLAESLISLEYIKQVCNIIDYRYERYNMPVWFDEEQIKTTEDKLKFCLYLITDRTYCEYEKVEDIIRYFSNNGCTFQSEFDRNFLIFCIDRIYKCIYIIREIYSVSFVEIYDYIGKLL